MAADGSKVKSPDDGARDWMLGDSLPDSFGTKDGSRLGLCDGARD